VPSARWRGHLRAIDRAVQRVALDRDAAGFADQAFEFGTRGELGRLGTGVVINFFLDYGAVQIVGAKSQRAICAMLGVSITQ